MSPATVSHPATIAEKVLLRRAVSVQDGFVRARVDLAMGHDATTALLIDRFRASGDAVWDSRRLLLVADHFSPPATIEQASILRKFVDFAQELPGVDLKQHEGICHQILVEDPRVAPGMLVVGADSHTVMAGALGCLATGFGSSDMLRVLRDGCAWFRIPRGIRVELTGRRPSRISGRDVALMLLGRLGEDGANYRSIEIEDHAELPMDDRFALCNAVVEAGAKCGILCPDDITEAYLRTRGSVDYEVVRADPGADYEQRLEIALDDAAPMTALPGGPCRVAPVESVAGRPIQRAFIGSCAGGRLSDLRAAAEVLGGHRVHPAVQLVVIPASRSILQRAMAEGTLGALVEAGAVLANPGCGPCGGISGGILAEGEVCVSTSTRNSPGRMGHRDSEVYLASARTVAISAIRGELGA